MKQGMFLLTLILALLFTGTIPIPDFAGFPTHIFNSPVFLVIVAAAALWTLWTFLSNPRLRKDLPLMLMHGAMILIVAGAIVRMFTREESIQFPVYYSIPGAYINTIPLPSPEPNDNYRRDIDLPFSLGCDSFRIDRYPATIELYQFHGHDRMPTLLKSYAHDDSIINPLPNLPKVVVAGELVDSLPMRLTDSLYLSSSSHDKWYWARLLFGKPSEPPTEPVILEPNAPVTRDGWRFYLMSYGERAGGDYIVLSAVRDPGRPWVIAGIWLLIAGTAWCCFRAFRRLIKSNGGDV